MLAYLIAGVAALAILAGIGYKVRQSGYDACKIEWNEASEAQRKEEAARSLKAAQDLEAERKKRKVVIRERTVTVEKNIEKLVDSGTCFSPDGVRTIRDAIDGKGSDRPKPLG